jgi:hypothetical protein
LRPGNGAEEAELAWSLADVASSHLDATARNDVFVAIGVGEPFVAIRLLLEAITRARVAVGARLAGRLWTWLDAYASHDDEPCLRRMIREASFGCWDDLDDGERPQDASSSPTSRSGWW